MSTPIIAPLKLTEYGCKQSRYGENVVPKLPTRCTILAPSFSGERLPETGRLKRLLLPSE